MNKLILAGAAAAMFAGIPAAMAADAECQAGSAWGPKPGCDAAADPPYSAFVPRAIYNNSGGPVFYGYPYAYLDPSRVTLADGRQYLVDPRTGTVLLGRGFVGDLDGDGVRDSRDTDRDGDGVRNRRDRYPDDPRFR